MPKLNLKNLKIEASNFSKAFSSKNHPNLYGVTGGKAVGTYVEHQFQELLSSNYNYTKGSSAIRELLMLQELFQELLNCEGLCLKK